MANKVKLRVSELSQWILEKKVNAKQPLEQMEYQQKVRKWIMEYDQVAR